MIYNTFKNNNSNNKQYQQQYIYADLTNLYRENGFLAGRS